MTVYKWQAYILFRLRFSKS